MTKIAIATHGNFAKGLKSTLELFIPNESISYLTAYVEEEPSIDDQIKRFFDSLEGESAIIFTDLLGGSVNQKVLLASSGKNTKIIAGFNLSLVLEVILNKEQLTEERLSQLITSARETMQVVAPIAGSEMNEDEFFA
ncbi:PTS sugar transporter subunit IIA [Candidatus Enterococcus murrayae]|uniref:PTS EIIA type-4 domain-containing protein n=1 Tax=Candidatus Enterococcus murrayae TaxID=2815321 RepID=A0ABS3HGZ9_9ENTE|nr:hypothetical protein [Enterococcus sp. MJM16]MBO0452297.1 hypothetical protein [Enterococcus sp. MJM16]